MREINLGQHAAAFSGEEISEELLLEGTDETLQELGVNSPIERLEIMLYCAILHFSYPFHFECPKIKHEMQIKIIDIQC